MKRFLKCFISTILVFSMLMSTMVCVVSAQTVSDIVNDENGEFDLVNLMVKLGVFKEGDEFPQSMSESITRAEYLEFAMRLCKNDNIDISSVASLRYTDVDASHPRYKTILLASALNVITYDEDDLTFKPDDYITLDEGIAVIINSLGFKAYALHSGPYPASYRVLASKLGLYKGIDSSNNDGILTYKTAYKLLYNGLNAPTYELSYNKTATGDAVWAINEENSILKEKYDVEEVKGVLTANDSSALDPNVSIGENKVQIDGVEYYVEDNAAYKYLGYYVRAYFKEDEDGNKTLVYLGLVNEKNRELRINKDDVASVTSNGSKITVTYYDKNDTPQVLSINSSMSILKNDKALDSNKLNVELFDIKNTDYYNNGELVFVSNDGAGSSYEVVFINDYQTVIVNSVNEKDKYIYDIDDASLNINLNKGSDFHYSIVDEKGNDVNYTSLKQYDVLSVAKSEDGKLLKMYLSRNSKKAVISSKNPANKEVFVGSKLYNVDNRVDLDNINLSDEGTLYFDVFGRIAYAEVKTASTGGTLGYIIDAKSFGKSKFDETYYAYVLSAGGKEPVEMKFAERVTIDGVTKKTKDIFEKKLMPYLFDAAGAFIQQGVYYKMDDEGKINFIDTAYLNTDAGEDPDGTLNLAFSSKQSTMQVVYKGYLAVSGGSGNNFFVPSNNTVTICVPTDPTDYSSYTTSSFEYGVGSSGSSVSNPTNAEVYILGRYKPTIDMAIFTKDATINKTVDRLATLCFVDKVVQTIDSDGMLCSKLYMYTNAGKQVSFIIPEEYDIETTQNYADVSDPSVRLTLRELLDDLKVGDVVQYSTDIDGNINMVKKVYDYETNSLSNYANAYKPSISGEFSYIFGQIYSKDDASTSIRVVTDPSLIREDGSVELSDTCISNIAASNTVFEVSDNGKLKMTTVPYAEIKDYKHYSTNAYYQISQLSYASQKSNVIIKNSKSTGPISLPDQFGKYKAFFTNGSVSALYAEANSTITLPDIDAEVKAQKVADNFKFVGWKVNVINDNNLYLPGDQYVMTDMNVLFTPAFEQGHVVSYSANGKTVDFVSEELLDEVYISGEEITLPECPYNVMHAKFMNWDINGDSYDPEDTFVMGTTPVTIKAIWEASDTAKFEGGLAGKGKSPNYIQSVNGETITLPANTYTNDSKLGTYTFIGWKSSKDGLVYSAGNTYVMPVAEDVTFTAQWNYTAPKGLVQFPLTDAIYVTESTDNYKLNISPVEAKTYDINARANVSNGYIFEKLDLSNEAEPVTNAYLTLDGSAKGTSANQIIVAVVDSCPTNDTQVIPETVTENSVTKSFVGTTPVNATYDFTNLYNANLGKTVYLKIYGYAWDNAKGKDYVQVNASTIKFYIDTRTSVNISFFNEDGIEYAAADMQVLPGDEITLPTTPLTKDGYAFGGWTDGINTYTDKYLVPEGGATLKIVWKQLKKINFVSGDANLEEDTGLALYADVNEEITLPANTYTYAGHVFNGWSDGSKTYKANEKYTVNADTTFTATWVDGRNAIFTSPYATDGSIDSIGAALGGEITLPEATNLTPVTPAGSYAFNGWKSSEDGQIYQPGTKYTMNNDVTFAAQWTYTAGTKGDNKFVEVYAQLIGAATGNPNGSLAKVTGSINLGRNNGSVMLGKIDVRGLRNLSSMTVDFFMSKVNNGLALKAYRVSKDDYDAFVAKAGTELPKTSFPQPLATSTPISQAYSGKDVLSNYLSTSTFGTNAPFDITALAQEALDAGDDYMYVLFTTVNNNPSDDGFSISSIANTNIVATSVPGYEISYVDSDDAPIETKGYLQNATVKLLKPEKAGYIFNKWTLAGTATTYDAEQEITITANMKLVASWFTARKITFASGNPSATGTMADVSVIDNSEYTIPKCDFAYTGKAFKHWSDGVNTYKTGDKVTITANKTLTAVWADAYTISFDKGTEGIGTQESVNIVSGETYTTPTATSFTSKNKVGEYALSGWTDGSNNYTLGQTITPTGSMTLKPLFEYKGGIKDQKIVIDNSVYYNVPIETTTVNLVYNGTAHGTINSIASDFSDNGFYLGVDLGAINDITSAKLVLPVGRSKWGSMAIYDVTSGWNGSNVIGGVTLNAGDNASTTTDFVKPVISETPVMSASLETKTSPYEIEVDLTDYFKSLKNTSKNIMFYVTFTQGGTDGPAGTANNIYNRLYMPGSGMANPAYFVIDSTYSVTTYDVTYDADGATLMSGKSAPATDAQEENAKFNLPDNVYEKNVVVGSYAFAGWSDGTNTYAAGSEYTMPAKAVTFKPVFNYTGEEKQLSTSDATYVNYATYTASPSNNTTAYSAADTFVSDTSGKRICYNQNSYVYLKFDLSGLTSSDITAASLDVNYFRILAKSGNLTVEGITETNAKASVFPATGSKSNPTTLSNVSSNALSTGSTAGTSTFDLKEYIQTRLTAGDKAIYLRLSYKGAGTAGANGVIFDNSTLKVDTRKNS